MSSTTEDSVKQFNQRVANDAQALVAEDETPRCDLVLLEKTKQLSDLLGEITQGTLGGEDQLTRWSQQWERLARLANDLAEVRTSCSSQLLQQAMATAFTSSSTSGSGGVPAPELTPSSAALVLATPA